MSDQAQYFPIKPGPYQIGSMLNKISTDFGNGARDQLFFQADDNYTRYIGEKRGAGFPMVLVDHASGPVYDTVAKWIKLTLEAECHPAALHLDTTYPIEAVQEDMVILQRLPNRDRVIHTNVCFPSGWRPEYILNRDFSWIHEPVPGFPGCKTKTKTFIDAMVERGPYVRFVWMPVADDFLDLHPDRAIFRTPWAAAKRGWLRVERQVTVPFPHVNAGLFLIRVYHYPFESLTPDQRLTMVDVIQNASDDAKKYKGWDEHGENMVRVISAAANFET